jgi:tetratricopeptide (TPR) repeat protein
VILGIGTSFSQENKDSSMFDSGMNQIIVPTQIITSTDGDTVGTLVNAEGQEANIAYNNGVALYSEGSYLEANSEFSRSLRINPEMAQAYYGRGTCYMQQGKYDEAITDLKEYVKRKEDNNATYLIGYCYFLSKNMDSAIEYFQNAIEQGCSNANMFYYIGVIYFNKAQYEEAEKYYTRSIEVDNKHSFSYNDRGSTYRMQEKYDLAIADYQKAIELNSRMDIFKENLGSAYRLNKEYEKALAAYDDAIKAKPDNYIALNNKGITLYEMKEYDQAIDVFNECLKHNKNYAFAYNNLGLCYYRKEDYKLAIEAFTKAITLKSDYGEAYVNRGSAREMTRDLDGACSDWKTAKSMGITGLGDFESNCGK